MLRVCGGKGGCREVRGLCSTVGAGKTGTGMGQEEWSVEEAPPVETIRVHF